MAGDGTLSSLVNFDCSCLLELVQVFRLALVLDGGGSEAARRRRRGQVRECVDVMRGMQVVGWTARAVPEVTAQLRECGVLDGGDGGGGLREWGGGGEGMELDSFGGFLGDFAGGDAGGVVGETYNNMLFLEIDFT